MEAEHITGPEQRRGRFHYRRGRKSSAHDAVRPSPARAQPHDAAAWLPLPAPEALPTVDELLAPEAEIVDVEGPVGAEPAEVEPAEVAEPAEVGVGGPGPGRAEPHDATAWLALPELDELPSIHELLIPDPDTEVPAARDITAVPSPARAEPHDATAWLPLPEVHDLPEITDLVESDRADGASPPPLPEPAGAGRRHRGPHLPHVRVPRRHLVRRTFSIVLVAATLGALFYGGQRVLSQGDNVDIKVDGKVISTETGVSSVASVLKEQKVKLGQYDRVVPKATTPISDGMTVRVMRAYPVTVDFDGTTKTVYTTHSDPHAFLAEVTPQLGAAAPVALRDAPKEILKATPVAIRTQKVGTLGVDGSFVNYKSPSLTVRELLASEKVVLGPQDFTKPVGVDSPLPDNTTIEIVRVATETQSVDEVYNLPDETRPDDNMNVGETRVQAGTPGSQRVTYSLVRHDGAIASKTVISAVPTTEAKPKITFFGTKADPRWDKIAECETGGNWHASGQQYQGGLGIYFQNWNSFGGTAFAPTAGQATREEQIQVAERIRARFGFRAWGCGRKLGYR